MSTVPTRAQRISVLRQLLERGASRKVAARAAEAEFMDEALRATIAEAEALDAHPDIAEQLRERIRAGKRGAL